MIFETTTAGTVREGLYDDLYQEAENVINGYYDENGYKNEHFLPVIYELDSRKEWTDEHCWAKANPGLGTIKSLEQLRAKVQKAVSNPKLVKNLLCKDFNIPETIGEAWLTFEQLNNTALFDVHASAPPVRHRRCGLFQHDRSYRRRCPFHAPQRPAHLRHGNVLAAGRIAGTPCTGRSHTL